MKTVETIVAEVWPEWQLKNQIGSGSFGEVYQAEREDATGQTKAAIKIIKIQTQNLRSLVTNSEEEKAESERMLQRVGREIRLMQSLKGQTNLVSIDDYQIIEDAESGIWYILIRMELLRPLLVDLDLNKYDEERLIRMGIELCRGLEVCAQEHIVHRDIKPENIFLNHRGDYKLGDFSVARTLDTTRETLTEWDFARGERFSAPEVKNRLLREAGFEEVCRADIYSLGMVLYWIANGQRFPFLPEGKQLYSKQDREEAEQKRLRGEPLPELNSVSPAFQTVIRKACAYENGQRYKNAREFREALEKLQATGEAESEENMDHSEPARGSGHRHLLPLMVGAFALIVAAALWLFLPVRIPVRYTLEDGTVLASGTVSLRPGLGQDVAPDPGALPEGYLPEESQNLHLSVSLLRKAEPSQADFRCIAEDIPTTLQLSAIQYPKIYAIGLPYTFGGWIKSDAELTEIFIGVYTTQEKYTKKIPLPAGTKAYNMQNVGDELLKDLPEGEYWIAFLAMDTAGRTVGFSNNATASKTAPEHTVYDFTREWSEPELRGNIVFKGHTYEIYRLTGAGWNNANAFAQGKGGYLVTFADEEEFNIITSFCKGMSVRSVNIGAEFVNGEWRWVDGSPFDFHPWKPDGVEDDACQFEMVGGIVYTGDKRWYFNKTAPYEMTHFMVEYDDILRY